MTKIKIWCTARKRQIFFVYPMMNPMMRADASRYPTVLGRCTLSLSSELLPPARSPRPPPPFCTLVPFWWRPASPFCPAIFARIQLSGAALDINSSHHSHGQKREGHCILLVLLHCAKKTSLESHTRSDYLGMSLFHVLLSRTWSAKAKGGKGRKNEFFPPSLLWHGGALLHRQTQHAHDATTR